MGKNQNEISTCWFFSPFALEFSASRTQAIRSQVGQELIAGRDVTEAANDAAAAGVRFVESGAKGCAW